VAWKDDAISAQEVTCSMDADVMRALSTYPDELLVTGMVCCNVCYTA
jgi:hypothetical protein